GAVPNSADVTFPAAGNFWWTAAYSGDTNNGTATSACASEPLTVGKAATSISTTLSAGSIAAGGSVHDTASVSGAVGTPSGTVTYKVYTDNTCATLAGPQPSPATVTLSGGAVPNSADVTFPAAGNFWWQASYSGDTNNGT